MAGKFELYKDKRGGFRFRLKASNGQIILTSQGYKAKPSARIGTESVRKNASDDGRYDCKETKNGQFRFNLKAMNGQVIGTSESYKTEKARDNGIASVKRHASGAAVLDLT